MRLFLYLRLLYFGLLYPGIVLLAMPLQAQPDPDRVLPADRVVLAVHGGAGVITRGNLAPEAEAEIRAAIERALRAGHAEIRAGRPAMDAVIAAIQPLEDDPHFNAGRGAVMTAGFQSELDASVMDGASGQAGAVAGVRHVKSPIAAARAVMEHSPHVLLAGAGAEEFALTQGLDLVPNAYFHTDRRRRSLEQMLERERAEAAQTGDAGWNPEPWQMTGTVGAVALDADGHLAAGTSTGGMTGKRYGRIGDSPIIGAGTFADQNVAISATGHGEFFIRHAVAYDIAARMKYLGDDVEQASRGAIFGPMQAAGGTGGVIALSRAGEAALPFNTEGMYRGTITAEGRVTIAIYGDE